MGEEKIRVDRTKDSWPIRLVFCQVLPKKTKINKNLPSIDQFLCPSFCNHSSLLAIDVVLLVHVTHEPITVKVYMSQEKHHLPVKNRFS